MSETLAISERTPTDDLRQKKRQAIFYLLAVAIVLPFFEVFVARWWHDEKIWMAINIAALMFPTLRWCFLDANERHQRLGRFMQLLIICVAALGIPVWLLRTRGVRGFVAIGWLLLLFALVIGANTLAEYVAVDLWLPHWL